MKRAAVHDIGKIGVRDEILLKNGGLTPEEFKEVMKHSVCGTEILNHIRMFSDIIPGIKHHHEGYDGSGYPDGLNEEEIPLIARIIAIADSFDAMTTDRPYRKRLSVNAAVEELKRNSGTQFDPYVVNAFLEAIKDKDLKVFETDEYVEVFR